MVHNLAIYVLLNLNREHIYFLLQFLLSVAYCESQHAGNRPILVMLVTCRQFDWWTEICLGDLIGRLKYI